MLASPSLRDVIAAAGVAAAAGDDDDDPRSSPELPETAVRGSVDLHDTSAARPIVDPVCASPASVPPTASPVVPAVAIAAASDDQPTLELSDELASASQSSSAPPASVARSAAVDPTPPDDVPPAPPPPPVEPSRPVPTLSAAWSARLDDGLNPEKAVAVVLVSVASQLPVAPRPALVRGVDGAADAQPLAVRMPSPGSALADMVWSGAVAESRVSVVLIGLGVEWPGSVGRRPELEPKLAEDVGAS